MTSLVRLLFLLLVTIIINRSKPAATPPASLPVNQKRFRGLIWGARSSPTVNIYASAPRRFETRHWAFDQVKCSPIHVPHWQPKNEITSRILKKIHIELCYLDFLGRSPLPLSSTLTQPFGRSHHFLCSFKAPRRFETRSPVGLKPGQIPVNPHTTIYNRKSGSDPAHDILFLEIRDATRREFELQWHLKQSKW
ncbi:hypothetical protein BYT27DRAFT_7252848 [Phlegmacium glaucopus]|nr:hypothetical protein BYT27DRAFT_7252848 [Phlegmacium glaucopus]